jgi:hypothetical protein
MDMQWAKSAPEINRPPGLWTPKNYNTRESVVIAFVMFHDKKTETTEDIVGT